MKQNHPSHDSQTSTNSELDIREPTEQLPAYAITLPGTTPITNPLVPVAHAQPSTTLTPLRRWSARIWPLALPYAATAFNGAAYYTTDAYSQLPRLPLGLLVGATGINAIDAAISTYQAPLSLKKKAFALMPLVVALTTLSVGGILGLSSEKYGDAADLSTDVTFRETLTGRVDILMLCAILLLSVTSIVVQLLEKLTLRQELEDTEERLERTESKRRTAKTNLKEHAVRLQIINAAHAEANTQVTDLTQRLVQQASDSVARNREILVTFEHLLDEAKNNLAQIETKIGTLKKALDSTSAPSNFDREASARKLTILETKQKTALERIGEFQSAIERLEDNLPAGQTSYDSPSHLKSSTATLLSAALPNTLHNVSITVEKEDNDSSDESSSFSPST